MKIYIFFLKILLLFSMLLMPLKALWGGFPNLYMMLSVSMPMFIALIFVYCLIKKKLFITNVGQILIYFIAVFLWMIIGTVNGYFVISEVASLTLMILSLIAINVSYNEKLISVEFIKRIAYFLMYCWIGFYAVAFFGMMSNLIPKNVSMQIIAIWAEGNPDITMDSGFLGLIPRFASGVNIFPLIIYAFYLVDEKAGSIFVWLMMLMFVLLDYGRIDMLFFAFLTLMFIYFKFVKGRMTMKKSIIIVLSLLAFSTFAYAFFAMNGIDIDEFVFGLTERYDRESTARYQQLKYLTEYINNNLWIGYGLGAYIPECIRSDSLWMYEMQFHAFLMQMGIIGFIAIVVNYLIYILRLVFHDIEKKYIFIALVCFVYWVVDSALQGGVFYGVGRMVCIVLYMFTRKKIARRKYEGDSINQNAILK